MIPSFHPLWLAPCKTPFILQSVLPLIQPPWLLYFLFWDSLLLFSHDMCVGNLSHGKTRETSHSEFLPYFPRQIRWSYLAIEICKVVIRMTYPKDSCNQNGFHGVCSLLLFLILQQRGERDSQTQAILTKLKCAAGEQILQLSVLSACLLAVHRAFWQQCVPVFFFLEDLTDFVLSHQKHKI